MQGWITLPRSYDWVSFMSIQINSMVWYRGTFGTGRVRLEARNAFGLSNLQNGRRSRIITDLFEGSRRAGEAKRGCLGAILLIQIKPISKLY